MAVPEPVKRDRVFISYSHRDKEWLERLQTMLKPLVRNDSISVWDDTRIEPGTQWEAEIKNALAAASVAVFLVSPNFLASNYITTHELPYLLKAAEEKHVAILWVAVSHCVHEETDLSRYQAINDPAQPLDSLPTWQVNEVLKKIALAIKSRSTSANP